MKKNFLMMTAVLLTVGFAACSKDSAERTVDPVTVSQSMRARGGNLLVSLPEERYEVSIPKEAEGWVSVNSSESSGKALVLSVEANTTGASRSTEVIVLRAASTTRLATVTIAQSDVALRNGEFVIEEIYFTGTALSETGKPDRYLGDQYIKIRNNTDEDLYADGMMLILSSGLNSGMNAEMPEGKDFRKECCAGSAFYIIPGNGQQVLVKAGKSLVVVNNAQNHTVSNPASWDATKADFEWYDVSSNDAYLDIDNPDVTNLDKWYAQTLTVHTLHNRGFNAIAIAMPPVGLDAVKFLAEYPLAGATYIFHSPNGSDYTMPLNKCYRVPNEWVLDAVNTGCRDDYYIGPWDASLDAGYAWCGTTDGDPDRFGKSVIRKSTKDGKLADTNNSTNDFESNVKASLIAQ